MSSDRVSDGIEFTGSSEAEPQRCPRCRHVIKSPPCPECDWEPLHETEMVFVAESSTGSADADPVPPSLALTRSTSSYSILTAMLVTAFIGVCISLTMTLPVVGIPLTVMFAGSGLRTTMLVRERHRNHYPTMFNLKLTMFINAFVALLTAGFVAIVALFVQVYFHAIFYQSPSAVGLTHLCLLVLTIIIIAYGTRGHWPRFQKQVWVGILLGCLIEVPLHMGSWYLGMMLIAWYAFIWTMNYPVILIYVIYAHRNGNAGHAMMGASALACGVVGLGFAAYQSLVLKMELAEPAAMVFGPISYFGALAAGAAVLQNCWGWDDAFPS